MRLLVEEAVAREPMETLKGKSPTGSDFDYYQMKYKPHEYCAIPIMRSGDSMLNEVFNLLPGISIGKILIQRDETTVEKTPIFIYEKYPTDIAQK